MINIQTDTLRRINRYIKKRNIESKVASPSQFYVHVTSNVNKNTPLYEKYPYSELFWFECQKMRTKMTPNTDTFYAVYDSYLTCKVANNCQCL